MKKTCHSEYGTLQSVYIKTAQAAFVSQQMINDQWQTLHYLSSPDFKQAESEYSAFEKLIHATAKNVKYFPENASLSMDSIYCRDASIATDFGLIICNMGKEGRKNEPVAAKNSYNLNKELILGTIALPGTIEGGDIAWLNENTLAVGRTYRTNISGIEQLKAFVEPKGIQVITVDLPHYKGESDVFHLMSILSPVDKNLAVVYSPLMPIAFRAYLLDNGFDLVEVPDEEFETMGCNVLALSPRDCIMLEGNPITQARLEAAGAKVTTYKGAHISLKGGGGPTCLTRPLLREV